MGTGTWVTGDPLRLGEEGTNDGDGGGTPSLPSTCGGGHASSSPRHNPAAPLRQEVRTSQPCPMARGEPPRGAPLVLVSSPRPSCTFPPSRPPPVPTRTRISPSAFGSRLTVSVTKRTCRVPDGRWGGACSPALDLGPHYPPQSQDPGHSQNLGERVAPPCSLALPEVTRPVTRASPNKVAQTCVYSQVGPLGGGGGHRVLPFPSGPRNDTTAV